MIKSYNSLDRLRIENLLVLCYALDEFEKFDKEMLELNEVKKSSEINTKLIKVAKGKKCLFAKQEKELYRNNQYLINVLIGYGNLEMFLWDNYYKEGLNTYKGLKTFMEYISKNRNNINTIIPVLEKIQSLGFTHLIFDEKIDFTQETYVLNKFLPDNLCVEYLDNLETIPNYNKQIVKYKTNNSNYRISLSTTYALSPNNMFNSIALNSLMFSPDRLPDSLTEQDTFDKIINLSSNVLEESKILKEAIDLNTSVDDLFQVYELVNERIDKIDSVASKKELIHLLNKIKEAIKAMDCISKEHNKVIISKYPNVTDAIIEEEHKEHKKKKYIF